MSSENMLPPALPFNPMLTKDEILDMEGKARALVKLRKHPSANIPKHATALDRIACSIICYLTWKFYQFQPEIKKLLETEVKCLSVLENIMIQVIIQGKDFDEIVAEERKKSGGDFLDYIQNFTAPKSASELVADKK